jgi:hypothetical protein
VQEPLEAIVPSLQEPYPRYLSQLTHGLRNQNLTAAGLRSYPARQVHIQAKEVIFFGDGLASVDPYSHTDLLERIGAVVPFDLALNVSSANDRLLRVREHHHETVAGRLYFPTAVLLDLLSN